MFKFFDEGSKSIFLSIWSLNVSIDLQCPPCQECSLHQWTTEMFEVYLYRHSAIVSNVMSFGMSAKCSCLLFIIILSSQSKNCLALPFPLIPWDAITSRRSMIPLISFWFFFDVLIESIFDDDDDDIELSPLSDRPPGGGAPPLSEGIP